MEPYLTQTLSRQDLLMRECSTSQPTNRLCHPQTWMWDVKMLATTLNHCTRQSTRTDAALSVANQTTGQYGKWDAAYGCRPHESRPLPASPLANLIQSIKALSPQTLVDQKSLSSVVAFAGTTSDSLI